MRIISRSNLLVLIFISLSANSAFSADSEFKGISNINYGYRASEIIALLDEKGWGPRFGGCSFNTTQYAEGHLIAISSPSIRIMDNLWNVDFVLSNGEHLKNKGVVDGYCSKEAISSDMELVGFKLSFVSEHNVRHVTEDVGNAATEKLYDHLNKKYGLKGEILSSLYKRNSNERMTVNYNMGSSEVTFIKHPGSSLAGSAFINTLNLKAGKKTKWLYEIEIFKINGDEKPSGEL